MVKMVVNPWVVSGKVDYDKLVDDFGIKHLSPSLLDRLKFHSKKLHPMLRRGHFFAHRDVEKLLDEYEKGNKFFIYTGCGPSGPLHLGHLTTWIFTKWLQDKFGVEVWFQFTDDEKFLFKNKSYDEIQKWTYENMLDVIALGFDPKKTHFLVDTKHIGVMYPTALKIAKKITLSTVKAAFGFKGENNIGEVFYTSMQAVPAVLPSVLKGRNIPCLIPLGVDQDPHFRVARDVYPKLGFLKPAILHGKMLPPLTGNQGKMSSSDAHNAILTTDSPGEVKKKINKYAFSGGQATVEEHREKGGNTEVDVSFQYLKLLFEPNDTKLEKIKRDYESGKLLTGELKAILIKKINAFLKVHQQKRHEAKKLVDDFLYVPKK